MLPLIRVNGDLHVRYSVILSSWNRTNVFGALPSSARGCRRSGHAPGGRGRDAD
jgi:hypothetical protein